MDLKTPYKSIVDWEKNEAKFTPDQKAWDLTLNCIGNPDTLGLGFKTSKLATLIAQPSALIGTDKHHEKGMNQDNSFYVCYQISSWMSLWKDTVGWSWQ